MPVPTRSLFVLLAVVLLSDANTLPGPHTRLIRRCDNRTHSETYGNYTWGPSVITGLSTGYTSVPRCGGYGNGSCIAGASGSQSSLSVTTSSYAMPTNGSNSTMIGAATSTSHASSSCITLDSPLNAPISSTATENDTWKTTSSFGLSPVNASTTTIWSTFRSTIAPAPSRNNTQWTDWTASRSGGWNGPCWTNTTSTSHVTSSPSANTSDATKTVFVITTDLTSLPAHLTITLHEPVETSSGESIGITSGVVSTSGDSNNTAATELESSSGTSSWSRDFDPVQATTSSRGSFDLNSTTASSSSSSNQETSSVELSVSLSPSGSTTSVPASSTAGSGETSSRTVDGVNTTGSPVSSSPVSSRMSAESTASANITSSWTSDTSSTASASSSVYWSNSSTTAPAAVTTTSCTWDAESSGWRDWNATAPANMTTRPPSSSSSRSDGIPITVPGTGTETIICTNATCSTQTTTSFDAATSSLITTTTNFNNPNASTICNATGRSINCPSSDAPWLSSSVVGTTFSTSIIPSGNGGNENANATTTAALTVARVRRGNPPHFAWARMPEVGGPGELE